MSRPKWKVILPAIVLIAGAGATAALIKSRKEPERIARPALGPLVEVAPAAAGDILVQVAGQGEVSPRVRVELAPQVTGRVVRKHPALVPGGRFGAGATLLEIDRRDFELAVERARSAVAAADSALARERAEADAARAEWRAINGEREAPPLVARTPQVLAAEAARAAARADLAATELALERTRLSLPFAGLVIDESVDVGALVTAGMPVATVYGTAAVEVRVPLEDRELAWIELPASRPGKGAGKGTGATARVAADFAGARHIWQGRVERLEGRVDPRSRMVHLVVAIDDPFDPKDERPPLLPGTFVEVAIEGRTLEGAITVPRHALRDGDTVWVAAAASDGDEVDGGGGSRLEIRPVEVLRRDRDHAYLGAGLEAGEPVIISALDAVTDGMTIRTASAGGEEPGDG